MMAIAAEGVGRLLAKCLIPGTRCGVDRARDGWFEQVMSELDMACATEDPVLQPYKSEFVKVRDAVAAGGLDDLPLAFKNGDMHALNILVTETGEVGGLVDFHAQIHFATRNAKTPLRSRREFGRGSCWRSRAK